MTTITMTAKRQATFPRKVCDELKLKPGARLNLERIVYEGKLVWILRTPEPDWSFFGAARKYAKGKSNRWSDVEKSIEKGMAGERGRR